jgi:hypothetical protein
LTHNKGLGNSRSAAPISAREYLSVFIYEAVGTGRPPCARDFFFLGLHGAPKYAAHAR